MKTWTPSLSWWVVWGVLLGWATSGTAAIIQPQPTLRDPTSSPVVAAGWCEDRRAECGWWAETGECEANPDFMIPHCALSCNHCPAAEPECVDVDDQCVGWSRRGECENNAPYMLQSCPYSCNACATPSPANPRMLWSVLPVIKNALFSHGQPGPPTENMLPGLFCSPSRDPRGGGGVAVGPWVRDYGGRVRQGAAPPYFESWRHRRGRRRAVWRGRADDAKAAGVSGGGVLGEPSQGGGIHEGPPEGSNRVKRTINKGGVSGGGRGRGRSYSSRSRSRSGSRSRSRSRSQGCNFIKRKLGKCGRQSSGGGKKARGGGRRRRRQRTSSHGRRQMMSQIHNKFNKFQKMMMTRMSFLQQRPQRRSFSRHRKSAQSQGYSSRQMSHSRAQTYRRRHQQQMSGGERRFRGQLGGGFLDKLKRMKMKMRSG